MNEDARRGRTMTALTQAAKAAEVWTSCYATQRRVAERLGHADFRHFSPLDRYDLQALAAPDELELE